MRRLVRILVVGIVVGLGASIGVAWACLAHSELSPANAPPGASIGQFRLLDPAEKSMLRALSWDTYFASPNAGFGVRWDVVPGTEVDPRQAPQSTIMPLAAVFFGAGWPMRCVEGEFVEIPVRTTFEQAQQGGPLIRSSLATPMTMTDVPWYSVRPILTGLAVDVALLGVLPVALLHGVLGWCAARRRRRDRCARCGYPRGTSPVCTECGHALPAPIEIAGA